MPEDKKPIFTGKFEKLSFEEAIKNAIDQDPRNVPGTDIFKYTIVESKVEFGGIVQSYTLFVTLRRDTV